MIASAAMQVRAMGLRRWATASLSLLLLSRTAKAQGDVGPRPNGAHVQVVISGVTGSARVHVSDAETDRPVAACWGRCVFTTEPGRYTVRIRDTVARKRRQIDINVAKASRFNFEDGDDAARTTGLVLGIVGPAALVAGVAMIMPALLSQGCHDSDCTTDAENTAAKVGVGLILVGTIATPIGWVVFADNRARLVPVSTTRPVQLAEVSSLRVGLVSVGGRALGLGGVAQF